MAVLQSRLGLVRKLMERIGLMGQMELACKTGVEKIHVRLFLNLSKFYAIGQKTITHNSLQPLRGGFSIPLFAGR